jgi:hypothetical protein
MKLTLTKEEFYEAVKSCVALRKKGFTIMGCMYCPLGVCCDGNGFPVSQVEISAEVQNESNP